LDEDLAGELGFAHPGGMGPRLPALRFEADAYQLRSDRVLGRQSAGDGFLRAALAVPGLEEVKGFGPNPATGAAFDAAVRAIAPALSTQWLDSQDGDALARAGRLHFPDPVLGEAARGRLALGADAWSLSGVIHTIASRGVMQAFADYAVAPLMEWDGVICTSEAGRTAAREILDEQDRYLAWRFPGAALPVRPQMPVIPLGVHA
jgi:alpha-maltose-1-phosphate synthase